MIKNVFVVIAVCVIAAEALALETNRPRRSFDTCGVPKIQGGLIVRGQDFPRGSFPWIVALMHNGWRPPKFFCGGSLISKTFVISAAHCILDKGATEKFLPREVRAFFGAHDLSDIFETDRIILSPKKIFIHDDWNHLTASYDADVSLLEFWANKIHFDEYIQPICLWDSENEPAVAEGLVTGWGKSHDRMKIHENKPKLTTAQMQTNEQCFLDTKALVDLSSTRTFCAGLRNGSGVCHGDSGGGLFVKVDGVYHLKGIVSSSLLNGDDCDVSKNAVYTNVRKFRDWIRQIAGDVFVSAIQALKNVSCTLKMHHTDHFGDLEGCRQLSQTVDSEDFVLGMPLNTTVRYCGTVNDKQMKYIPRKIGEKFPNLVVFEFISCGLTVVRDFYLKNMRNVRHLYLNKNEIKTIESGAFDDLISVEFFLLHENMIETLDKNLFSKMINLHWVLLKQNKIKSLSPTTFRIPGGKLQTVALWSNVCIDKWYGPNSWDVKPVNMRTFSQLEPDLRAFCA